VGVRLALGLVLALTTVGALAALPPAAQARPGTEPRAQGVVLWNGDFSPGDLSQYPEVDVDAGDRATVVDDPILGPARKALRFTVHNTSRDPTSPTSPKHRAQAASPRMIRRGDEVYIGFSLLLPRSFPTVHGRGAVDPRGTKAWQCALHAIYGAPHAGSSPQGLGLTRSEPDQAIRLVRNGSYRYDSPWSLQTERGTPADVTGRWIDVVIRTKMSASPAIGFREQWVDTGSGYVKQRFANGRTRLRMRTVDASNGGGPNSSKLMLYFNHDAWPKATVYFAAHRIGTSFSAVAPRSHR